VRRDAISLAAAGLILLVSREAVPNFNTVSASYTDLSDHGTWTVSSYKFGFGTECLRDNDASTFWQCVAAIASHGHLAFLSPTVARMDLSLTRLRFTSHAGWRFRFGHTSVEKRLVLTMGFVPLQKLALYLAFMSDDSYTPQSLQVRAGTGLNDLQDVRTVVLDKPTGWVVFDLSLETDDDGEG